MHCPDTTGYYDDDTSLPRVLTTPDTHTTCDVDVGMQQVRTEGRKQRDIVSVNAQETLQGLSSAGMAYTVHVHY